MTYGYRIHNWNEHFENHRSRDLDYVRWLMVPNKQHGMGFTRIISQPDGVTIFGFWYLIIEACSQQKSPRLGWLTDDGRADGNPWTIADMAERWRCAPELVARAMDVLCSPRVGWMETVENVENSLDDRSGAESDMSKDSKDVNGVYRGELQPCAGETRGHRGGNAKERSGEEGAERQGDAAATAAGDDDLQKKNRIAIRVVLAKVRWVCTPSAVEDWVIFLKDAKCQSIEECEDCLHWIKREARKDGVPIKWARNADGYEVKWKNRPRVVGQSA